MAPWEVDHEGDESKGVPGNMAIHPAPLILTRRLRQSLEDEQHNNERQRQQMEVRTTYGQAYDRPTGSDMYLKCKRACEVQPCLAL